MTAVPPPRDGIGLSMRHCTFPCGLWQLAHVSSVVPPGLLVGLKVEPGVPAMLPQAMPEDTTPPAPSRSRCADVTAWPAIVPVVPSTRTGTLAFCRTLEPDVYATRTALPVPIAAVTKPPLRRAPRITEPRTWPVLAAANVYWTPFSTFVVAPVPVAPWHARQRVDWSETRSSAP